MHGSKGHMDSDPCTLIEQYLSVDAKDAN